MTLESGSLSLNVKLVRAIYYYLFRLINFVYTDANQFCETKREASGADARPIEKKNAFPMAKSRSIDDITHASDT